MNFGSVCSGIEAASVAFAPLGWKAAWFSEIEPFPSSVLAHHYPNVPNHGDMTRLTAMVLSGHVHAPDMLCGGTPCQAFSVAGKRESLGDERGNLSLVFCELANAIDDVRAARGDDPAVILWENVPGVLSTKDNAFGCFLAGLAGEDEPLQPPGKRWEDAGAVYGPRRAIAWRTLDAQYFGLAQRRRRVFVVASARNGFDPAQVLFEWDGVRRDSAPSREAGKYAAAGTLRGTDGGSDVDHARAAHLIASGNAEGSTGLPFLACSNIGKTVNNQTPLMAFADTAHTLRGEGFDASEDGTGRGTPLVETLTTDGHAQSAVFTPATQVRRLTPRECERLQGFPDDYTLIPGSKRNWTAEREEMRDYFQRTGQTFTDEELDRLAADGPRYKALGNSWAVPCVRWIGERIAMIDSIRSRT